MCKYNCVFFFKFQASFDLETFCYQPIVKFLPISNSFNQEGLFRIRIVESNADSSDETLRRFRGFSCQGKEVMLSKEDENKVEIAFHPMSIGEYSGRLVFSNPTLGDFMIELRGRSHYPKGENLAKGKENVI